MKRPPQTDAEQKLLANLTALVRSAKGASWRGRRYASIPHLLLEQGEWFDVSDTTVLPTVGPTGMCYMNALQYAVNSRDVSGLPVGYVEVVAFNDVAEGLSFDHAWVAFTNGHAVETTWPEVGTAYFGITLRAAWAMSYVAKRKRYGVLDDFENRWPLLRTGLPAEAMFRFSEKAQEG